MTPNNCEEPDEANDVEGGLRAAFKDSRFPPTPQVEGRVIRLVNRRRVESIFAKTIAIALAIFVVAAIGYGRWWSDVRSPQFVRDSAGPAQALDPVELQNDTKEFSASEETLAALAQPPMISLDVLSQQQTVLFDVLTHWNRE